MKLLQLAGAAALCGALLLTACAKKSDQSTTASTDNTTTTQSANASPAADVGATTAPASDASPAAMATSVTTTTTSGGGTSVSTSSGSGASDGYIDIPVYPGAAELKDQAITSPSNGTSVTMRAYSTKDDAKRVSEWYKSHLPAAWKNGILTAGGKTVGTFSDEHADGDQSVIVANQDETTTRIQITTKHGK